MITVEDTTLIPNYSTFNHYKFTSLGSIIGVSEEAYDWDYLIHNRYPDMSNLLADLNCGENYCDDKWRCGDNGKSCGPFQYQEQTFFRYCSGRRENPIDQLDCAYKMIKMGLGSTTEGWYNTWRKMNLWKYEF